MEEIARDVFEKLYPTEEIGIHKRLEDIETLLCKQPWGIRSIGIYGDIGIGKTTLARAVFRQMSSGYDAYCFIKDFHKEYTENSLVPLSDEYLGYTPMEKFDYNLSDSETSHRRKRVLIVLDDVRNGKDAVSFLVKGFGLGSLIIITSREKQVLEQCKVNEIYELKGLNQEDALKLFTRSFYGKDVTDKKLLELSMEQIEDTNGNPSDIREEVRRKKGKPRQKLETLVSRYHVFIDGKSMWINPCEEEEEEEAKNKISSSHSVDFERYVINSSRKRTKFVSVLLLGFLITVAILLNIRAGRLGFMKKP